ncbi:hypothetical protein NOVOSPHI9U_50065 [Novosphingobium sp. 9U]|nr:hypothetical protein NOVOSPHI9U_50065 [Novosphingobium sp. 9U]
MAGPAHAAERPWRMDRPGRRPHLCSAAAGCALGRARAFRAAALGWSRFPAGLTGTVMAVTEFCSRPLDGSQVPDHIRAAGTLHMRVPSPVFDHG